MVDIGYLMSPGETGYKEDTFTEKRAMFLWSPVIGKEDTDFRQILGIYSPSCSETRKSATETNNTNISAFGKAEM